MNKIILAYSLFIFASCAQRLKVPINRMDSPEVIGTGLEVQYDQLTFSNGILNLAEGDESSLIMSSISERSLHLGLGIVEKMDIFVKVPKESSSRVGIKIQLLGEAEKKRSAGNKLSMVLATGSSTDLYQVDYKIGISSKLKDYALIHGYRFNENVMIYESISLTNYEFSGKILEGYDLDFSSINYMANNILGINIGVILGPPSIKFKGEIGAQRLEWSYTDPLWMYAIGYSLTATW